MTRSRVLFKGITAAVMVTSLVVVFVLRGKAEENNTTTGAVWVGTIKIDEPEHRVSSQYTSSRSEFTVTMVEKISGGGSVSLELQSLDWRKSTEWKSAIDRGYESWRHVERGQGNCAGESESCKLSGSISYSEDRARPFGMKGIYSVSIQARGMFRKTGFSTSARHVQTGPMSHRLEPTREQINEESEGEAGVRISGELVNGMRVMRGERGNTSWHLSRAALPVTVEMELLDEESYRKFIPSMGQGIGVRMTVVEPAGMMGYPCFELENVSRQPGYCMNAEIDDDTLAAIRERPGMRGYGQEDPDWFLEASERDYHIQRLAQKVVGKDAVSNAVMTAVSLDAGAFGRIRGYMVVDGVPYQARIKDSSGYFLDLPLDDWPNNHIADAAEQNEAFTADEDLDDTPIGNGDGGDGLTAYEEYRGFMVAGGAHVRTDPGTKTIFVLNRYGHYWLAYRTLGLESYDIEEDQLPPVNRRKKPGYINYYYDNDDGAAVHVQDQYVVIIEESEMPYRRYGADGLCIGLHPPSEKYHSVYILPEYMIQQIAAYHTDVTYDQYLQRLIDHELGHRIGIDHHGNIDMEDFVDSEGGSWNWVAVEGGEHSGDLGCVMRYHCADGIMEDSYLKIVGIYDPPTREGNFCSNLVDHPECGFPDIDTPCRFQFWIKSPQNR